MMTAEKNHLYVSPEGDDAWSGLLAAANADRTDGPLASPAAARDAARKMEKSADCPVTVHLAPGRYRIAESLQFGPEDSFVTYVSEQPLAAAIDAGVQIAGWRETTLETGVKCWVADATDALEQVGPFRQMFAFGRRAVRARLPKDDWYWMDFVPETDQGGWPNRKCTQKTRFQPKSGHFQPFRNIEDVDIVVTHWWSEDRRPVARYDEKENMVHLAEEMFRPMVDDLDDRWARYYIDHVFEGLSEPGEWYLDRTDKKVYYVPREGEAMDNAPTFAAGPALFLHVEGDWSNEQYVENVCFEGVVFEHSDWRDYNRVSQSAAMLPGAITVIGARGFALTDCAVRHVGNYAMDIQAGCMFCRVVGCTIEDIGAGGIKADGSNAHGPVAGRTGRNVFCDNVVRGMGRVHHSGPGIILKNTFGNLVMHNHIHDVYYTGVSVGWVWGYHDSIAKDNRIEFNHIHDIGQGWLNDMGAIYLLGVAPGTALRNNLIHDVRGFKYGGWAIYPDEGSSHVVIENNVCYDCASQLFHLHFGRESSVRNNIWAFAEEGIIAISRGSTSSSMPEKAVVNDGRVSNSFTFIRNIVITDGSPVFLGGMERMFDDRSADLDQGSFISDMNVFHDVSGKDLWVANGGHTIAKDGYYDEYTWDTWRSWGNDRFSIVADPKFRDLQARDFSLADDSAALDVGFQPIDLSTVGPRPAGRRDIPQTMLGADPAPRR